MNFHIINTFKVWKNIPSGNDTFENFILNANSINNKHYQSVEELKKWFTLSNFFNILFTYFLPSIFFIASASTLLYFLNLIEYKYFTFLPPTIFIIGYFFLGPRLLKAKILDFEKKLGPYHAICSDTKNKEYISLILPDLQEYCNQNNLTTNLTKFISNSISNTHNVQDVLFLYSFFNYYFEKNVTAENYNLLLNNIIESKNENISFFQKS